MEDAELIKVSIATHRRPNTNAVGIGVTAMIEGDIIDTNSNIYNRYKL